MTEQIAFGSARPSQQLAPHRQLAPGAQLLATAEGTSLSPAVPGQPVSRHPKAALERPIGPSNRAQHCRTGAAATRMPARKHPSALPIVFSGHCRIITICEGY